MATKTKQHLDTTHHQRRRDRRLKDQGFKNAYDRSREEIRQIDEIIRKLDDLRAEAGFSKAELARQIGKDPASIRRLFTATVNPELKTVAAIAAALNARVQVVSAEPAGRRRKSA